MFHATSKKKHTTKKRTWTLSLAWKLLPTRPGKRRPARNEVMRSAVLYSAICLTQSQSLAAAHRSVIGLVDQHCLGWRKFSSEGTTQLAGHGNPIAKYALAGCPALFGFVALGWFGKGGLPMTLLRLESFSLFVDGGFVCASWDTCLASFPMQGSHGWWWSRSICSKLKSCLPIRECR